MCGIAGQIGRDPRVIQGQYAAYCAMQRTLARRGPDQRGMYISGRAALIHARLAVVDLENGCQPMQLDWQGESYTLVYNGELYNTPELRALLETRGHVFTGRSDTEVLLHAYAEWGASCVDRFNGIFAFAVWAARAGKLFLARDRCGVKPLFYAQTDDSLIFGSEIKTLLAHPAVPPRVDAQGLAEVLLLGPGRVPGSGVFQNVHELLPGQYTLYEADSGRLLLHRYWRLVDHEHPDDFPATVRRVRDLVMDAIQRQLVSDVPVATFLSGGLDSSLISAVADAQFAARGRTLQTFSVGYKDNKRYFHATKFQPGADAPFIRRMNEFLHAEHHWVTLDTPDLIPALYEAVEARDLPGMADVDASLLAFCQRIKPHATVALSGECADEIFGGYPWYRDPTIREKYGFPWAQSTAYRAGFIRPGVLDGIEPEEFVDAWYRKTLEETSVRPGLSSLEQRMRQMMNLNFTWFMQTLLDRKDRMSMYSGLEVRVPFCDHRIAEYLYSVPWEFKDYQGKEKGLLREAMEGVLPPEVLWRKKSPYPKTWNPDYLAAVSQELKNVLADPAAPLLGVIRADALETLLASGTDNPVPWYGQLMTTPQTIAWFLQFNHWLQTYKVELV
ncbi:MAG: asparagine synthase (glutamine-hydrolyzing) [Blautia massiliensis (ex Durand et al. 2017)]|nr:MAG: asparagine synthase (glutamine-hydrolyzing) [Subdoligranulum variabile]